MARAHPRDEALIDKYPDFTVPKQEGHQVLSWIPDLSRFDLIRLSFYNFLEGAFSTAQLCGVLN